LKNTMPRDNESELRIRLASQVLEMLKEQRDMRSSRSSRR
jgi:hypothetical protein